MNHEKVYRGENFLDKLNGFGKILVCGAGALGSNLVDTLVRQGFSNITCVDFDRVEESNINTQTYTMSDIGLKKVAALKNRIWDVRNIEIECFDKELTNSNIKKIARNCSLIVDCFDNNKSRQLVQDWSRQNNIPCLHAGMLDGCGEVVWDQYYKVPKDTNNDDVDVCDLPLARNLITIIVSIIAEEIQDFCLESVPRVTNWRLSLKDLKIGAF